MTVATAQSPSDLGLVVPGDEWRSGQYETIWKILTSPNKYVLIEAPTGSGKTAIGLGTASILSRDDKTTYLLTATKELQDQYMKVGQDLDMVMVTGRQNHPCEIDHRVMADQGICTLDLPCGFAGTGENAFPGCGYYDMLRQAMASNIVLFNMAYLLTERQYVGRFGRADLLIIDEAHETRNLLTNAVTLEFRKGTFDRANIPWPDIGDALGGWLAWAINSEGDIDNRIEMEKLMASEDRHSATMQNGSKIRLRALASIRRTINRLLLPAQYIAKTLSHEHVQFVPVWPAPFSENLLLSVASKVVFMTATPGSPKVFADSLGINHNDMEVIRLPSTFDSSRRPLLYWPQGKVSGFDPSTWDPIVQALRHILSHHATDKGLVCCVSYKLGAYLANALKSEFGSRIMFPNTNDRKEALAEFRNSSEPKVMISPSMSTGVDLPFDQCRFVVVPKLPFADRSDPVVVARSTSKLGRALGITDTANNLVQSYGRAMRDETDWGVTWLLDGNFDWFRSAAKDDLPRWFTEAIRFYNPSGNEQRTRPIEQRRIGLSGGG